MVKSQVHFLAKVKSQDLFFEFDHFDRARSTGYIGVPTLVK